MNHLLALSIAMAWCAWAHAQLPESVSLHFASNSAEPFAADVERLRELCSSGTMDRAIAITITGHSDASGNARLNEALRSKRALRVQELLRSTCGPGIPTTVLQNDPPNSDQGVVVPSDRRVEIGFTWKPSEVAPASPVMLTQYTRPSPLIPSLARPIETYRVDPEQDIDLVLNDGTRLHIPAGAIVDEQGRRVTGTVDLEYRSFLDAHEIMASGLPMHVNTADGVGHFETAGMYELLAKQNGEDLALAAGSTIQLERPEEQTLASDFLPWRVDANGAWTSGGTLTTEAVARPTTSAALATTATTLFWRRYMEIAGGKVPDSTLFDDRRASSAYCHLNFCNTDVEGSSWGRRRRLYRAHGAPEIMVAGWKGMYDPDNIVFTLEFRDRSIKQFPELRRLPSPMAWVYTGTEGRAMFKQLYRRHHVYQDVRLERSPDNANGTLYLKENGKWLAVPVAPVLDDRTESSTRRWERGIIGYQKTLADRRKRHDRTVVREMKDFTRRTADANGRAWAFARSAMDTTERAMDQAAFVAYAATRRQQIGLSPFENESLDLVRTTFGLQSFGLYNIDRIMKMAEQRNVVAAVRDAEGNALPWTMAYAVLSGERSLITYWGNGTGSGDEFLVAPGRMQDLFLVTKDGRVHRADVTAFNNRTPRATLKAFPIGTPTQLDELRAGTP